MQIRITHTIEGVVHRNSISSIRGEYAETIDGQKVSKNRIRQWTISDIIFRPDDMLNERLYAIQWIKDDDSTRPETEFRSVTDDDLAREKIVTDHVQKHLADWQEKGWVPDMRIEPGAPPRYEGRNLLTTRGWTHWHHLFNPRQLFVHCLLNKRKSAYTTPFIASAFENSSRLCRWNPGVGNDKVEQVFSNQALNTIFNYGARGISFLSNKIEQNFANTPLSSKTTVLNKSSTEFESSIDIFITDPPYGDAVKYEEILDFFIAWLRKNPPAEFKDWVWDSRRALAVKGEDHDFKLSMVAAYRCMAERMPDNGLQIIMFTHQSNSIWADMANIVWASGLKVSAAWYIVTETDSALRSGQYVKGTILLVLRKRTDDLDSSRDELAYEIEDEVKSQVQMLTGLNQETKDLYRDENLFEDADLQMAGYAAALRVLTKYSVIDGVSMPQEALRPRVKGQTSMVDELIEFAVNKANEFLVPQGLDQAVWDKLNGSERFYLKMVDTESCGPIALSDCQNYAKAFKVCDYECLMDEIKANKAKIKSATGFGKRGMGSDEFGSSVVRASLYGIYLLAEGRTKSEDVIHQLKAIIPDYYQNREQIMAVAHFLSKKTGGTRPAESTSAMVLRDLVRNERA